MKLKNITFKEYFKVVGVSLAVPGFSWFIIWFEWQNADAGGRIAGPTLTILVHLIFLIPLCMYYPRKIDISKMEILAGPTWSSTYLNVTFCKLKVNIEGEVRVIRLVR